MSKVHKTRRAEQDLDDIWLHIAADNIDAADAVLDRIGEACAHLASHRYLGRIRPELAPRLRSFVVGTYILFYLPERTGIELVRVLHGARDITFQQFDIK